jgi:hypothetical protein
MKHEFPKAARDLLARQNTGVVHPSADILTAYAEQSLSPGERAQVLAHLATCSECRDVLFLAGASAEQAPAAAPSQGSWAWRHWRWAVPALTLITIVSAVSVQRWQQRSAMQSEALHKTIAVNEPPPASTVPQQTTNVAPVPVPEAHKPEKRANRKSDEHTPAAKRGSVPSTAPSSNTNDFGHAEQYAWNGQTVEINPDVAQASRGDGRQTTMMFQARRPTESANSAITGGAPPAQAGAMRPKASAISPAASARLVAPVSTSASVPRSDVPVRWRITEDGHLEMGRPSSQWTRVMSDQPVLFRVVSMIEGVVWAGGSNGALFRSTDNGQSWQKVVLSANGATETHTIVSIRFDTPQQGSIGTDNGATWTTSDGGESWIPQ